MGSKSSPSAPVCSHCPDAVPIDSWVHQVLFKCGPPGLHWSWTTSSSATTTRGSWWQTQSMSNSLQQSANVNVIVFATAPSRSVPLKWGATRRPLTETGASSAIIWKQSDVLVIEDHGSGSNWQIVPKLRAGHSECSPEKICLLWCMGQRSP